MAVNKPSNTGGARQAPGTDAKQAPQNEPKKPQDNSAAKQAPKETGAAVQNAFGGLPAPKGNDASPAPAKDAKSAAPADGKTATDPKATPDTANERVKNFVIDNGEYAVTNTGNQVVQDPRGVPVQSQDTVTPSGDPVYKDVTTDELISVTQRGYVFKVDPATNDLARDGDGNIVPALYDPVNSDPTRPPVMPNEDPERTLKNLPLSRDRGDPMAIKNELFDTNGVLDVNKLQEAAGRYDPRDVYDALINSSKYGGWDNMDPKLHENEKLVHPDETRSRETIAALIAWQKENGKYNPIVQGQVPPVVFYSSDEKIKNGYARDGDIFIKTEDGEKSRIATLFHELNHAASSAAFRKNFAGEGKSGDEVVTEYLANNWTGDKQDGAYETDMYPQQFKDLENAVLAMGNGDRNRGMDILKRAYFGGDHAAIEQLAKAFASGQ